MTPNRHFLLAFLAPAHGAAPDGGGAPAVTGPVLGFVAAVGVLAVGLLVWNRVLKRQVRLHTLELRRSQERFRAIFANNFHLTGLLDPGGILIEANPAALDMVGAAAHEVIGRPFWEGPWWTHDRELQDRVRDGVREAAAGRFVRFEATHPTPAGTLRLIDFSLKPVHGQDGSLLYLLPEGRDVTDERHGEVRYRTLFESAGDAIFVMSGGVFRECNARALELFRCERREIIGRLPADYSPDAQPDGRPSRDAAAGHIARARREGIHSFEWRHRRHDGTLFDAEVTLTSYAAGGQEFLQAIVRDVSRRKQLEGDLRHAQKMEAIGTLAGGIAHDFNNILAAILGFGELALLQAQDQPALAENLDHIMRAGHRARALVRQILAFSRRTVEQRQAVDLAPVVRETLGMLRPSIPVTISLREELHTAGPVLADPNSLHQVLMNLCTNAYQSMAAAGGELSVRLREEVVGDGDGGPAAGQWVVLEVRDDGPGMAPEVVAKIFEPYFTTKGAERGTGLGLAVAHGIIQEHQGFIEVETAPGEGALFRVWLPRRAGAPAGEPVPAGSDQECGGSERVMLVDDEPDIVRVTEMGLARHGYAVTGFTAPEAALAAFAEDPAAWDVVVTDMTMPRLTGLALAGRLLAARPDLPVILCTGYSEGLSAEAAAAAGLRALLLKPLTAAQLAAEIRTAVDAPVPVSVRPGPDTPPGPVPRAS